MHQTCCTQHCSRLTAAQNAGQNTEAPARLPSLLLQNLCGFTQKACAAVASKPISCAVIIKMRRQPLSPWSTLLPRKPARANRYAALSHRTRDAPTDNLPGCPVGVSEQRQDKLTVHLEI